MKILTCKNVTKTYRIKKTDGSLKKAFSSILNPVYEYVKSLDSIDFEVYEGECVGILGTNGSGKSTLTKLFTGLLDPTKGEIEVLGFRPSARLEIFLKNIGVVFGHKSSLWWDLPLIESFKSHQVIYDISYRDFNLRLQEASQAFDLEKLFNRPVKYLSLGERVKAEITANLLHAPKILFLDEPTVGLDIISKYKLRQYIKKWSKEKGMSIILTSHDMIDIEECCDQVLLLEKGKNEYYGSYKKLKQNLIKYYIFEAEAVERPLTQTEQKIYTEKIRTISTQTKIIKLSHEKISVLVDNDINIKDIIHHLDPKFDVNMRLRLPSLEEALREYYLENR